MIEMLRKLIPSPLFRVLQSPYHFLLSFAGALFYGFPSRKIKVVGITGTKGKTSTAELVNAILEEAGFKTALAGTLRFKIAEESSPNKFKMTMPGRFFLQKFIRKAVSKGCDWVVLEMTSEGAKQYRHKFIELDALIFTNLSPEHIEAHGSFEKYLKAKLSIGKALENSGKRGKIIVANKDDIYGKDFLSLSVPNRFPFSMENAKPWSAGKDGVRMTFEGEEISSALKGEFNIANILAAATFASAIGISPKIIKNAVEKISQIKGRVEFVSIGKKQDFDVVVDYAHTIESLTKLYEAFPSREKICVLGNTGGGRDKWKRKGMAEVADKYCREIILTNEDPYDEDPLEILEQMKDGIREKPYKIILDRREAIREALEKATTLRQTQSQSAASEKPIVLITGKGTDPYIMGSKGEKTPWDDATVAREELDKLLA